MVGLNARFSCLLEITSVIGSNTVILLIGFFSQFCAIDNKFTVAELGFVSLCGPLLTIA